jgi:hypothetical protein
MESARYSCQFFMKLEFCRDIFEKYSSVRFHDIVSSGKLMRSLFIDTRISLLIRLEKKCVINSETLTLGLNYNFT